jgi:hypothetical protein
MSCRDCRIQNKNPRHDNAPGILINLTYESYLLFLYGFLSRNRLYGRAVLGYWLLWFVDSTRRKIDRDAYQRKEKNIGDQGTNPHLALWFAGRRPLFLTVGNATAEDGGATA